MPSVYCVAEAGVNHNGSVAAAHAMIDAAKLTGADAVKFQAFHPELIRNRTDENRKMLEPLQLPANAWKHLGHHAYKAGLGFIVTPFDLKSLEEIQVPWLTAIKIAHPDIDNYPLLNAVNDVGLPVIMSLADIGIGKEVDGVDVLSERDLTLLHCVPEYPTPKEHAGLWQIKVIAESWDFPVGFSDHTDCGPEIAGEAVRAGAVVLEKHFTLFRGLDGPDHKFSFEPQELKEYFEHARLASLQHAS